MIDNTKSGAQILTEGGPAFPNNSGDEGPSWGWEGITTRDYFAAKALAGFMPALAEVLFRDTDTERVKKGLANISRLSYATADAMLEARRG